MPSIYTEVEFFYLQMKSLNGYGYLHNYHLTKTMVSDTSLSVFSTGFDHTQFFFFWIQVLQVGGFEDGQAVMRI